MGDPSNYSYHGSVTGASADVEIKSCPFRPRKIRFYVDAGSAGYVGYKSDEMAGDDYFSTKAGDDDGVTITDTGCTIANGADINVASAKIHYEMEG